MRRSDKEKMTDERKGTQRRVTQPDKQRQRRDVCEVKRCRDAVPLHYIKIQYAVTSV